jgi:DNA repair protein RecO (recombination protein O)
LAVRRAGLAKQRVTARALVVRLVPYGESDLVVGLYTDELGLLSALARGARRSARRFGSLEPMHLMRVTVELVEARELATLIDAVVERARIELTESLGAVQAAGRALRWLRRAAPLRVAEPRVWVEINALLDALGEAGRRGTVEATLGAGGLRMLEAAGWGLELGRCVRCDRAVPEGSAVTVDVAAGGVVCRRCGGAAVAVSGVQRVRLLGALGGDETALADPTDRALALRLVEQAIARHGKAG